MSKKVLLIAGGGALGSYTEKELLRLGHSVDVICLNEKVSNNSKLRYFNENATLDFLQTLFNENHYDGIVNFLHYYNAEEYEPYHKILSENTDHLIFVSSYRVYADEQHPVTETAPLLCDVIKDDEEFFEKEVYALGKCRCEKYLNSLTKNKNWSIIRPVISFAGNRFDLFMYSGQDIANAVKNDSALDLPLIAKSLTAGLDWAGNSGKLIANILFKPAAFGEAYTVSSGQNLTWGQVAQYYNEIFGLKVNWVENEKYLDKNWDDWDKFRLKYDRLFSRDIDCSKVLKVTGLNKSDFCDIKTALTLELEQISKQGEN